MRNILRILLLLTSAFGIARSQEIIVNPGVKLGYVFGDRGGFVFGAEVSWTRLSDPGIVTGVLATIDICGDRLRLHGGVEGGIYFLGVDVGPSIVIDRGAFDIGVSIVPYGGFLVYPYYNYTATLGGSRFDEVGSYIKVPHRADGRSLFEVD